MITGQKVVCIDGHFDAAIKRFYTALPVEGVIYTIRGSTVGISPKGEEGELCVYLVGIQNPCSNKPPHRERGFKAERFRPLQEMTEEEIMALSKPEEVAA